MHEVIASWVVKMWDYIASNLQFIINGFVHAGISKALDGEDDGDTPVLEVTALQ